MASDWLNIVQRQIQDLQPYLPGKPIETVAKEIGMSPEEIVKLASNENPLGVGEKARSAIADATKEVNRYPDNDAIDLKSKLANQLGVQATQITLGNGSCEVLDMIGRAFLGPNKGALYSQHAFAAYPILTQIVGGIHQVVPAKDYGQDLEASLARIDEFTRVIFVTNPNNPTGTWLTRDSLASFLAAVPASIIVVLDEAYIEYVRHFDDMPDGVDLLKQYPNLIVTRTFSKAYGLAGLRIGYGVSSPDIASWLNRVRQPFNANLIALAAASAALDDADFLKRSVDQNSRGLAYFESSLASLELAFIPSRGNFITVEFSREGKAVFDYLIKRGIILRPVANYELPNHLRISVGTDQENERCINALADLKEQGLI